MPSSLVHLAPAIDTSADELLTRSRPLARTGFPTVGVERIGIDPAHALRILYRLRVHVAQSPVFDAGVVDLRYERLEHLLGHAFGIDADVNHELTEAPVLPLREVGRADRFHVDADQRDTLVLAPVSNAKLVQRAK